MTKSNVMQEHRGVAKVHTVCADMDAIWRPTSTTDLGIDGQIEFLEPGSSVSTGLLLAVQVKSGPSYFATQSDGYVKYTPAAKHRKYWGRLALPVILVLHNPDDDLTIYSRVKPQLKSDGPILVSLDRHFAVGSRADLVQAAEDDLQLSTPEQILSEFAKITYTIDGDRRINGIHFLLASVHPDLRYFEIRMCRLVTLLELVSDDFGVSIGSQTYDFLLRCVMKVWTYQLTEPFVSDFEKSWYDLQLVPDIAVSLTSWGLTVLRHLWANVEAYVDVGCGSSNDDPRELAHQISRDTQIASDYLDASDRLGEKPH